MTVSRLGPRDSHDGINSKAFWKVKPSCSVDSTKASEKRVFLHIRINYSRSLKTNAVYSFGTLLIICKAIRCRIPEECNVALT